MAKNDKFPPLPKILSIVGVRVAGIVAGLKDNGKHDLFVAELAPDSTVAGTLTRSFCPGAPVEWNQRHLSAGKVRGIVASSGDSNVFSDQQGRELVANRLRAARNLGRSIVDSTLVRVGIAGAKPRAGRIIMAMGKAGEKVERDWLSISIGDIEISERGESLAGFDSKEVVRHLKIDPIYNAVDIGSGRGKARVWAAL